MVLQKIFTGRIPFLKYFLKRSWYGCPYWDLLGGRLIILLWNRYSAELLRKKPYLKGRDIEATRKACANLKTGRFDHEFRWRDRFTSGKHTAQNSPYKHLLKPRSGGISYVLSAMGENMRKVIDVTIVYPDGVENVWEFLCSIKSRIIVRIEVLLIDQKPLRAGSRWSGIQKPF